MKHLNLEPQAIRRLRRRAWIEKMTPTLACAVGCGATLGLKAGGAALAAVPGWAALFAVLASAGPFLSCPSARAEAMAEHMAIGARLERYRAELACWCWTSLPLSALGLLPAVQAAGGHAFTAICAGLACGALGAAWRSVYLARKLERLESLWSKENGS